MCPSCKAGRGGLGGLLHVNKLTCVYCAMWCYSGALYETYISKGFHDLEYGKQFISKYILNHVTM